MDFSPASIFTSLIVSGVGYVLFSYGHTAKRVPHLLTGICLFLATYLAPGPLSCLGSAAALLGLLWFSVKRLDL